MASVKELAVKLNREASASMARTANAMPPEKVTWQPLEMGRTTLDQIQECGAINHFGAKVLQTREAPPFDEAARERFARLKADHDTLEKALKLLDNGTEALVAAIEAFPEEDLDAMITLPFGPEGMTMSFAELMLMSYWNVVYHQGQINYIQTLYGDKEMH
jgi:hypothetical protein